MSNRRCIFNIDSVFFFSEQNLEMKQKMANFSFLTHCLSLVAIACVSYGAGPDPEIVYRRHGDVIIGGLFGLHYSPSNSLACMLTREFQSLKRVEAMVYAIDRVNADDSLLPDIELGFHIFDTCYYDIVALGRAMNFVPDRGGTICSCVNDTSGFSTTTPTSAPGSCPSTYSADTQSSGISGGQYARNVQIDTTSTNASVSVGNSTSSGNDSTVTESSISGGNVSAVTDTSGNGGTCCSGVPLVGLVGAERSESSMQAATLMGLHDTPQISYLSTSDSLSNKNTYPYFLRTVPPDRYQVSVIVDILMHFNWSYVSFLYSDDEYGQNAYAEFLEQSANVGICIGFNMAMDESAEQEAYDDIYASMLQYPYYKAKAVVLFTHPQSAIKILHASLNGSTDTSASGENATVIESVHFTWIASDGVGNIGPEAFELVGLKDAALGMLATIPFSETLSDFDEVFKKIDPTTSENPWAEELFNKWIICPPTDNHTVLQHCRERLINTRIPSFETLVMDAVYAYAHAMDAIRTTECAGVADEKACVIASSTDGANLVDYLFSVSFESLANGNFSFNADGDGEGRYAIDNYHLGEDGSLVVTRVGYWQDTGTSELDRLLLNGSDIRFYSDGSANETEPPHSICSYECDARYVKVRIPDTAICCWDCQLCNLNEIVINETVCVACASNALPDPETDYTTCYQVDSVPLLFHSWLGPFLVGISSVGLVTSFIVLALYLANIRDILLQGSDPVLHILILFGIVIAFVLGVLYALPASEILCTLSRVGSSLVYTIIYVPLAIKCVRLYRIFKKAKATDSQEDAELLSLAGQLALISLALLVQGGLETTWLLIYPSRVIPFSYERNGVLNIQLACDVWWPEPLSNTLFSLPFLFMCCIFSILARHLPDNYHEARFIAFSAFGSCILVAAFSVPYVTAELGFEGTLYASILASVDAILVLVCVFVIKLYAVIYVTPEMPSMVSSALAPAATTLGTSKARSRTRTTSSSNESHRSTTNLVRRPAGPGILKEGKEVTFSDIRPQNGHGEANNQTENTKL